jgi:hypothetical protein
MWPVVWTCSIAAACLLQVLLPMGEPVVVYSLVTSCFCSNTEDGSAPAPNEDAEDEPGDELPSALTPRRLGLWQFGLVLRLSARNGVIPPSWRIISQDQATASIETRYPIDVPLRC